MREIILGKSECDIRGNIVNGYLEEERVTVEIFMEKCTVNMDIDSKKLSELKKSGLRYKVIGGS